MRLLGSTIAIALICLVGCNSSEPDSSSPDAAYSEAAPAEATQPETPSQGIQAIMDLYAARDFDSLIRTRYAEISKAENEEQIQFLIDRLDTTFQDDDQLSKAIALYASALQAAPEFSEDGTVVTFEASEGLVRLSRMSNGTWGFHL